MKIAIHLPVFGRYKTLQKALKSLERVRSQFAEEGIESDVYMIGHEPKMERLAKRKKYVWVKADNKPLGTKFNAGITAALLDPSWTHLMEFCSDNILDERYVPAMVERMRSGEQFIGLREFYIHDSATKQTLLFKKKAYTNVGRMTERAVLERMSRRTGYWFEPRIEKGLDTSLYHRVCRIGKVKPTFILPDTPYIVDLKDEGSMHTFAGFARKSDVFPVVHLVGEFPELNIKTETDGTTHRQSPVE